jgi:hypothetical protein
MGTHLQAKEAKKKNQRKKIRIIPTMRLPEPLSPIILVRETALAACAVTPQLCDGGMRGEGGEPCMVLLSQV